MASSSGGVAAVMPGRAKVNVSAKVNSVARKAQPAATTKISPMGGLKRSGQGTVAIPATPVSPSPVSPVLARRPLGNQSSGAYPIVAGKNPFPNPGEKPRPASVSPVPINRPSQPAPSVSARLKVTASAPVTPVTKSVCSRCEKVLSAQCLKSGSAILQDGELICVECVRTCVRRKKTSTLDARTILTVCGAVTLILAASAIFIPGQVLLILSLLSAGAVILGCIGFSFTRTVRFGLVLTGLLALAGSAFGIINLRQRAEGNAIRQALSSEIAEINETLKQDSFAEAQRRVSSIEQSERKKNSEAADPRALALIVQLHSALDGWVKANFGEINAAERACLDQLYRKFGSHTPLSHGPRFRAIHIADAKLALTAAIDPLPADGGFDEEPLNATTLTGDKALDEAVALIAFLHSGDRKFQSIELKLVSGPASEPKDILNVTLDESVFAGIARGDTAALKTAVESAAKKNE